MADKRRSVEWGLVLEYLVVFGLIPVLVFWYLGSRYNGFLSAVYYLCVSVFVLQASMSYFSSLVGVRRYRCKLPKGKKQEDLPPVPKASVIVVAYLPNELDVIEDTLVHVLDTVDRPADGIEVILAYNTPHTMPIEKRLRQLAVERPELILANAHESRSKSENLNHVLQLASGEIIAMVDADHRISSDCLARAWRWLATGSDVVQGRCVIRNADRSLVSSLVSVEFEGIYGVQHQSKSIAFDTALFGGSAGVWKASVIKKVEFDKDMLTEDIDMTLRSLVRGTRFLHDRSIISTELAPESLADLWFQRKRWAQGWFECSLKYQLPVLASNKLSIRAKFMWTWLLMWRVTYDCLSNMLFPVLIAYWLNRSRVVLPINPFIVFAFGFTMLSGPMEAMAAYVVAVKPRFPLRRLFLYSFMAFPYTLFRNMIQMVAIREHLLGKHDWVVTSHSADESDKKAVDEAGKKKEEDKS